LAAPDDRGNPWRTDLVTGGTLRKVIGSVKRAGASSQGCVNVARSRRRRRERAPHSSVPTSFVSGERQARSSRRGRAATCHLSHLLS
jgi:hypothetical protein